MNLPRLQRREKTAERLENTDKGVLLLIALVVGPMVLAGAIIMAVAN